MRNRPPRSGELPGAPAQPDAPFFPSSPGAGKWLGELEGRSWALSVGVHLLGYGLLFLLARPHFLDMTKTDWATLAAKPGAVLQVEVEDEVWRIPGAKIQPADHLAKPKAQPNPGSLGTLGGYRSAAQVSVLPQPLSPIVPAFPDAARRANVEGAVIIQVDIDEAGLVKQVAVVQGLGYGCDESALEAVRGARFAPARIGDQAVPVRVCIPFRFQFQ